MPAGGVPIILPGEDFSARADALAADYPGEFCACPLIAPDTIERSCLAGFFPMAARAVTDEGRTIAFLLPKLHLSRCLLDPADVTFTATTRRESSPYRFSANNAFLETVEACAEVHGEDWLVPELREAFLSMHLSREASRVRLLSFELWREEKIAAGEIGYLAGNAYASLSGFRKESGAGSVQLAALGRFLEANGIALWDLGMPDPPYKISLGGKPYPRSEWLPAVRSAYRGNANAALSAASALIPARSLLERKSGHRLASP